MPCILAILILAFPRVVMVLMFLFTHYLQRAYHMMIVLLLGSSSFQLPRSSMPGWSTRVHRSRADTCSH